MPVVALWDCTVPSQELFTLQSRELNKQRMTLEPVTIETWTCDTSARLGIV